LDSLPLLYISEFENLDSRVDSQQTANVFEITIS
jgi:hypothetical protein